MMLATKLPASGMPLFVATAFPLWLTGYLQQKAGRRWEQKQKQSVGLEFSQQLNQPVSTFLFNSKYRSETLRSSPSKIIYKNAKKIKLAILVSIKNYFPHRLWYVFNLPKLIWFYCVFLSLEQPVRSCVFGCFCLDPYIKQGMILFKCSAAKAT